MFLRTERLFLRPNFPEDWRALHRGIADEGVVRMLASAPWPYREADARSYCARNFAPRDLRFAITVPGKRGALIGQIGADFAESDPEVGYWIARDHCGHGYATEAVQGLIAVARMLGTRRLRAGHYLDNPASGAVLRKCGFVETGEIRPTHALGRGGELVLARRYERDLTAEGACAAPRGKARKPA